MEKNKENSALNTPAVSKGSNLKNELAELQIALNSKYGAYGHIEPSLEQQKIIRDRIEQINEELKNVC